MDPRSRSSRPPGHHPGRAFNGGFLFFNNIGVALQEAPRPDLGAVRSALIVDIDLHYGNGTDDIFKDDDHVGISETSQHWKEPVSSHELDEALAEASHYDIIRGRRLQSPRKELGEPPPYRGL